MSIRKNIEELLESGITAHAVAKDTGITRNAVYKLFNKESSIDNIALVTAEKLSNYWEEIKMNKLTVANLESTFDKVVAKIGDELQSTSTYLMRANSVIDAAKELELTITEFLELVDKPDYDRIIDYAGPIIWADFNKESFTILLHSDDEAIETFCGKVLVK